MSASAEQLQQLIWGFRQSRVLLTAIELDVFSKLSDGSDAANLARNTGTDPRAMAMLLNALVTIGVLSKKGEQYFNTEASSQNLTGDGRMAAMHQVGLWERWSSLTDCVRAGTAVLPRKRDELDTRAFIAAMHRNASERARHVVRAVDARQVHRMLDLGGGSGAYSIAFAEANTDLHGTILDRPDVLKITAENLSNSGLCGRIKLKPGDMLADELPHGHDFALLSQICHSFSAEENRQLMRRIHDALEPGGRIAIQEFLLDPDRTSPAWPVLFSLNMLVNTAGGATYSEGEISAWLAEAGFKDIRHVPLPPSTDLLIARK